MECAVLNFGYTARGFPDVPGADPKHGGIKEDGNWWSILKPAVDRIHPLLCYLWEEAPGLFAVFADPSDWSTIDPSNARVSLQDYFDAHDDWLTCRGDGSDLYDVLYPITVPAIITDSFTVVEWLVGCGNSVSTDQNVLTIQRDSNTIQVKTLETGRFGTKYKNPGNEVTGGDQIGELYKKDRLSCERKKIKLVEKPNKMPTPSKPLTVGDFIINSLYPSIHGSIGIGDRVSEAESGSLMESLRE